MEKTKDGYVCTLQGIPLIPNETKIRIIHMDGEPQYSGKEGIVRFIDGAGQIHGTWGGCAVIPEIDKFEIIKDES